MIALTLSSELCGLTAERGASGRTQQLAVYVDRWCDIEARAEGAFASAPGVVARVAAASQPIAEASGKDEASAANVTAAAAAPAADASAAVTAVTADAAAATAAAARFESLLEEVGALAGELSLPNATSAEGPVQRARTSLRFAVASMRQALGFCARGIRILGRDVVEVVMLLRAMTQGKGLQPADTEVIKRTVIDCLALVPYTIIMIIPLSPPGHVFAFSLMKKCFPAAIPSPFTAQRQDIYDIYTRIALEAQVRDIPWPRPISSDLAWTRLISPDLPTHSLRDAGQRAAARTDHDQPTQGRQEPRQALQISCHARGGRCTAGCVGSDGGDGGDGGDGDDGARRRSARRRCRIRLSDRRRARIEDRLDARRRPRPHARLGAPDGRQPWRLSGHRRDGGGGRRRLRAAGA